MKLAKPICDCKSGHKIISPVIGTRCRNCGAERRPLLIKVWFSEEDDCVVAQTFFDPGLMISRDGQTVEEAVKNLAVGLGDCAEEIKNRYRIPGGDDER